MIRWIFAFLLALTSSLSYAQSGSKSGPELEVREGRVVGADETPKNNISSSLKLTAPSGQTVEIPPDILNMIERDDLSSLIRTQVQKPGNPAAMLMREEILIPFIVFTTAPLMVLIIAYFAYRNRKETQDTIRLALQNGQTLPDNVLAALDRRRVPNVQADLRKAVLLSCIGLGGIVILFVANPESPSVALLGLVPCILGLGYFFLWWHAGKTQRQLQHERV